MGESRIEEGPTSSSQLRASQGLARCFLLAPLDAAAPLRAQQEGAGGETRSTVEAAQTASLAAVWAGSIRPE